MRLLASLALLLVLLACSIENPAGTSWISHFQVVSMPETLHVSSAGDNDRIYFDQDSLLVFFQEVDTIVARVGDSLRWRDVAGTYRITMPGLIFEDQGAVTQALPFIAAYPQHLPLIDQVAHITSVSEFTLELGLPAWPDLDWIALREGDYRLELSHDWPFAIETLSIEVLNRDGQSLGLQVVAPDGGIAPHETWSGSFPLSGLLTAELLLRIDGRNLPMTESALIEAGQLQIELIQEYSTADSARAHIPPQVMLLEDSIASDTRMRILQATSDPSMLDMILDNQTELSVELDIQFPRMQSLASGEPLQAGLVLAPGTSGQQQSMPLDALQFDGAAGAEAQYFQVMMTAWTVETPGMHTLRAGDGLDAVLRFQEAQLRTFDGYFLEDIIVEIERESAVIDEWPTELDGVDISNLEMRLRVRNEMDVTVYSRLELDVLAGPGAQYGDTSMLLTPLLLASDSLIHLDGVGRIVSRLPHELRLGGELILPRGDRFHLLESSVMAVTAFEVAGRFRLLEFGWESEREWIEEAVPPEVLSLRLESWIQNRIPFGGHLIGKVSSGINAPGVELYNFEIAPAAWDADSALAIRDTVRVFLMDEALAVMNDDSWYIWYEFAAEAPEDVVELRAHQWLSVQTLLQADLEIDLDGDE